MLLSTLARSSCETEHIQDSLQRIIDLAVVLVDRVVVVTVTALVDDVIRCSEGDFRVLPLDLLHLLHNNNEVQQLFYCSLEVIGLQVYR